MVVDYVKRILLDRIEYPIEISRLGLVDSPFTSNHGSPVPLKQYVEEWLKENCCGTYTTYWTYIPDEYPKTQHFIRFNKKEDAVAFKLKWV